MNNEKGETKIEKVKVSVCERFENNRMMSVAYNKGKGMLKSIPTHHKSTTLQFNLHHSLLNQLLKLVYDLYSIHLSIYVTLFLLLFLPSLVK